MIRIICPNCKESYLENKDNSLTCPACESVYAEDMENLLLGVQYYNECDYDKANDCLMKFIVKNGADAQAIFYKTLCDGFCYDEDTITLTETYDKLLEALKEIPEALFPKYLALANDEMAKLEKAVAQSHIYLFVDADAEKIKKEVSTIINLQNEAKAFRVRLNALTNDYNDKALAKLSVKFSECFLIEPEIATQVGNLKFKKITENVASHTVFTGILSTDIKNLEIYYRCIVMFFKKNREKYDFLMASSEKFTELATLLEEGQYTTIKGTNAISDKLKAAGYDFFQESLKDNDDDFETQTETVVILSAPEEEPEETEEVVEDEDVSSSSMEESTADNDEASLDGETTDADAETEAKGVSDVDEKVVEEDGSIIEIPVGAEEKADDSADVVIVEEEQDEVAEEIIEEAQEESAHAEEIADDVIEIDAVADENVEQADDVIEVPAEEEPVETIEEEPVLEVEAPAEPVKKVKRKKSYAPFITAFLIFAGIIAIVCATVIPKKLNAKNYATAQELMAQENYEEAVKAFAELGDYEDSAEKLNLAKYNQATKLELTGKYEEAKVIYKELKNYEDSIAKVSSCTYNIAIDALDAGKYDEAKALFETIKDYADSKDKVTECTYQKALSLVAEKKYAEAIEILTGLGDYSESKTKILDAKYKYVNEHLSKDDKTTVAYLKDLIEARYLDSVAIRRKLLGASALADGVSSCINYDESDFTTNLEEVENSKPIYFHVTVADQELYGKKLTAKFTTSVGYTERKSVTLTEGDNTYSLIYPRTYVSNYSVEFSLLTADGTELVKQTVEIK